MGQPVAYETAIARLDFDRSVVTTFPSMCLYPDTLLSHFLPRDAMLARYMLS